jgi:RNA polymerase sigma-70 factor, ECF subfamily
MRKNEGWTNLARKSRCNSQNRKCALLYRRTFEMPTTLNRRGVDGASGASRLRLEIREMSTNPSRDPSSEGDLSQREPTARSLPVADSDLWRQLKLSDEQAIAELYDRYSQVLFRVANQVLHDPGTSEDVLQEVFLQLWRVPDAFDPAKGSLATWLTIVSRRRAIDRLRERKGELDVANVVVPINAKQLADAALNQITDKVRLVLEDMPEKLRVPFELAYAQGLTHREISEQTGDPLGTTKSRIRLAMNLIRKKLDCNRANANGNGHV